METQLKQLIPEEMKQFHYSILLNKIKDIVRKNPTLNSINEKCARNRRIFSELLPAGLAGCYAITSKRGETKKIDIVRSNVIMKCKLPNSQGS